MPLDHSPDALPPLGVGRRLLFGLLTALLFAAALEGLLAALGVADPATRLSLTRGFSPRAHYFVPDASEPGALRTQMFSGDSPEVLVPPRGPRLRVLLMGESSTEGFPEEHIQARLDAALPDPGFEVINLGRHGYGSERVRILLAQALELKPDVVLIYLGHNEFVEQGFALELARQWRSDVAVQAVDQLARLHTMTAAVSLAESLAARGVPLQPEAQQSDRAAVFRELTYDRTELFYKVYRDNLRAMVDLARDAGASVLLSTVVANDFDPPSVSTFPADLGEEARSEVFHLRGQALAAIPARFRTGLIQTRSDEAPIHLRPSDWGELARPEDLAARRARAEVPLPPALRTLAAPFTSPCWSDPRDWSAAVPALLATYAQVVERAPDEDERRRLQVAATRFDEALAICPDHPHTLFELGLVRYLLGDDAGAARLLRAAGAYDRAPTHGNDIVNSVVRELAAERAGDADVRWVDADGLVRAACPQGLVGYELMMDNCHMHAQARYALVDLFVPPLLELAQRAQERR